METGLHGHYRWRVDTGGQFTGIRREFSGNRIDHNAIKLHRTCRLFERNVVPVELHILGVLDHRGQSERPLGVG